MTKLTEETRQFAGPAVAPATPTPAGPAGPEAEGPATPVAGLSRPSNSQDPMGGAAAPESVSKTLSGGGSPLPAEVRRTMESSLGGDFGNVRVHNGGEAARSADEVQAKAYTSGNDIVFGKGAYDTSSNEGLHTLAHELTHVVQQQTGRDHGTGGTVGMANDPLEHEAEATAHNVVGALRRQSKDCDCGQEH